MDDSKDGPDLAKRVAATQDRDLPCILCGSPTKNRGVFEPFDPLASGVGVPAEGKMRVIIYPLCDRHQRTKALLDEVEAKIRQGFN